MVQTRCRQRSYGAAMASKTILARNLRRLRAAQELSQADLAAKSGAGIATIKRAELGRSGSNIDTLDILAPALGVTPAALLTPPVDLPEDVARLIERWVAGERMRPRLDPPVSDLEIAWMRSLRGIWSILPLTERSLQALVEARRSRAAATDS